MKFIANPVEKICGEIEVPGDKSISHRVVIFGAIAAGITTAEGFLEGEDAISTINAFRSMGINIIGPENGKIIVEGKGISGLSPASNLIDCGNSGTTMRLLTGLLSAQKFSSALIGDHTLMKRPMRRVSEPLIEMGAKITLEKNGCAPININPSDNLQGINFPMKIASAQVKSAVLIAGLFAKGGTTVIEPAPTRDHSERMLSKMGANLKINAKQITIEQLKAKELTPLQIIVPGDFSSATFWLVACSIAKEGSEVLLKNVGINPTRNGALEILKLMGANITIINPHDVGGEPVADLLVKSAPLNGINIPQKLVSLAIDEFPVLFIAASWAQGITKLTGAEELRVKESDRLASMAAGLQIIGVNHELLDDGIIIEGNAGVKFEGGEIQTNGDHRIAMSFAVAALCANAPIIINDSDNVATSYPTFVDDCQKIGMDVKVIA